MNFFNNGWDECLDGEFNKEYFKDLMQKVDEEYNKYTVYPPRSRVFSALTSGRTFAAAGRGEVCARGFSLGWVRT